MVTIHDWVRDTVAPLYAASVGKPAKNQKDGKKP